MAFLVRAFALLAVLTLVPRVCAQRASAQETIEAEVKAAFLYHFTKYVDWPSSVFQDAGEPFRMCVVGTPAFVTTVESLVDGETARARPIQVVVPQPTQFNHCHMLFIGAQDAQLVGSAVQAVANRPVLTVVESPALFDQGSAILLAVDNSRVRFDIRLAAIQRAGLGVSAKLLRVARQVVEGAPVR